MRTRLAAAFAVLALALAALVGFANPASADHAQPGSECFVVVELLADPANPILLSGNVDTDGHNCVPSVVPGPLEPVLGPLTLECDSTTIVPLVASVFVVCPTNPTP